ncbi:ribonuclease H-like domain-containing protein [Rhizophagus irregularis DAOM 181602=DAOM 197198]|uniref:BED-type domain-containing protein n=2 Tax=Rhizophagus irregularis (strain DAOM 181602 / DAOM 197198 / MUCL 43194) TaxID=747089 RepID=A0A2P4P6K4_RHIID|nr:hypothetical protein GLOIN_2v1787089 [Rhizophagus irregularis DAOM 181602=DAOM 197198]POG61020.1 hypothetical protein GLOIN_2v1787089 [Rhizophagus irregularis DAOM 181602=DAOM 197198]GBC49434.2 ribonuclease H-like domain-containing protein [Rhizophagus irregularis DAOM 181602=DAOM 197198]|eukprot:XP_025167886.1 hypothetical protein GLOIN_2v1787089 [Rhizophagus irregularis DAOM 181602=DAOM 197198]
MEKESETHIKSGRPQSGVWKYFDRGESKGDGHWKGTCKYCKKFYPCAKPNALYAHLVNNCKDISKDNLNDISIDKPLTVISLAFIMCGIPFHVINNPFFINALKILNPNYIAPFHKTLSKQLLDNEVAKVNNKIDEILEFTNNLTISLNGWTVVITENIIK